MLGWQRELCLSRRFKRDTVTFVRAGRGFRHSAALEIRIVDPQVRPLDLLNIRTLRLLELCDSLATSTRNRRRTMIMLTMIPTMPKG